MSKKKLSGIDYHEAMDRCAVFERLIDSELLNHPVVMGDRLIRLNIENAVKRLASAYQLLGEKRFEFKD